MTCSGKACATALSAQLPATESPPPKAWPPARTAPRFCCKSRSKFRPRKTPLSHGLTGLAAIKAGAKTAKVPGAVFKTRLATSASAQPSRQIPLPAPCVCKQARSSFPAPLRQCKTPPDWPGLAVFCSFFESKFKAPKTPPSHGLTGLAAIKAGAKINKDLRACGALLARFALKIILFHNARSLFQAGRFGLPFFFEIASCKHVLRQRPWLPLFCCPCPHWPGKPAHQMMTLPPTACLPWKSRLRPCKPPRAWNCRCGKRRSPSR